MPPSNPADVLRDPQAIADYVHLVEDTGAIICVCSFESVFLRVSAAFGRVLGYSVDEMVGQKTERFLHPDDAKMASEAMMKLATGEDPSSTTLDYVIRYPTRQGDLAAIAWNAFIDFPNGRVYCYGRDITPERKLQADLEARSRLESLLTRVSTEFAALPPERTDAGITNALAEVAQHFGVERTYVLTFRDDRTTVDNTHEHTSRPSLSRQADLQGVPFSRLGWFFERVRAQGECRIDSPEEFPPGSSRERAQAEADGVKSQLAVAMSLQGEVVGFLGLESFAEARHFTGDTTRLLGVLADVFVGSLDRQRSHEALREKLATIERQQVAIRALSTPVIEIWEDILTLPLVGVIDSERSAEMTSRLLAAIGETGARCVIVDVTGVDIVDTMTADHLIRMIRAARLLGAYCVLTGLSPDIAQTLVRIGVDLRGIRTLRSLKEGLKACFLRLRQLDEGRGLTD